MFPDCSTRYLTEAEWRVLTPAFRDLSYRHCGSYAQAAAKQVRADCEFVGVYQAGELIGLANVRVKRVPLLRIGIAYVNHGPLSMQTPDFSSDRFASCLSALQKEYVDRRRLLLRIVPPLGGGRSLEAQGACLNDGGFRTSKGNDQYETFIVDLDESAAQIRQRLDGKWRRCLTKAESNDIRITVSSDPSDFRRFERLFDELAKKKDFDVHQDAAFFRRVCEGAPATEGLVVHLAWHDDQLVAGHVGSFVGDTAVYLLGAASPKGRTLMASYLLQWAVIEHARSSDIRFYDLGGIDQDANPDVYRFKKRLNGRRVSGLGPVELAPNGPMGLALNACERMYKGARALGRRRRVPLGDAAAECRT